MRAAGDRHLGHEQRLLDLFVEGAGSQELEILDIRRRQYRFVLLQPVLAVSQ
jgi:hypothetical protein